MVEERTPRKELAIRLLAHGYTTRAVNFRLQDAGHTQYPESELIKLRMQYSAHIDDLRERNEIEVRERGLARTSERIRRLTLLAEKLERRILASDLKPIVDGEGVPVKFETIPLKAVAEYRRLLAQIQTESTPLGIMEALGDDDPWVILITRLTRLESDHQLPSSLPLRISSTSKSRTINGELSDPEPERKSLPAENEPEKVSIQR